MVIAQSRLGSSGGFTVVEVLIAMIVLAIGLLGLLGAATAVIRNLGEGDKEVTSAYYANERLERLDALGCDQIANGSEVRQGIYNLSWTVDGSATSPVRHILLTVAYPLSAGRSRTDTLEKALTCLR
jgi:prepilin-type N-terminal cleavage/methylation domain-containing protein